jgi:leucyl-tRNA synthetase
MMSPERDELDGTALALARKAHWAIDKVTGDVERFQFNTAIAALMELVNEIYRVDAELRDGATGEQTLSFAIATVASLLFPFAPHLAAEVYERSTGKRVWEVPWPDADPALLESDTVQVVVQVNGKVRDSVEVEPGTPEEDVKRAARERPNVQRHLDGQEVVREIAVPGKLVNFVVR